MNVLLTPAEQRRVDVEEVAIGIFQLSEQEKEQNVNQADPPLVNFAISKQLSKSVCSSIPFFRPEQLYEKWVSHFSRPTVAQLADSYRCPISSANGFSIYNRSKPGFSKLGRTRKKLLLASYYAIQASWGAFCVAYVLLFAMTRSEVATAWFFSWVLATVFEILYISPLVLFAMKVLMPATVGAILERQLEKAKEILHVH